MDKMSCLDCDLAIDRGDGVCLSGHVVTYDEATLLDHMPNCESHPAYADLDSLLEEDLLNDLLHDLRHGIDPRASYAVLARFGLLDGKRKSFREVGESLGVTAEAARRLVSRAVAGLRDDAEQVISNTGAAVAPPEQEQVRESAETVARGGEDSIVRITLWDSNRSNLAEVFTVTRDSTGCWSDFGSGERVSLNDLLSVSRDSAISIETLSGAVSVREIASHLPTGREHAGITWDRHLPETYNDRIDGLEDALGTPVFLDQRRIGLVSLGPEDDAGFHWLEFETDEWGWVIPAFERPIASCSDTQTNSMTGGLGRWCAGHIDDQLVCFFADIDEHGVWAELEPRGNRSDSDIAIELSRRAGEAAGLALRYVLSTGIHLDDFYLEELDPSYSGWVCSASFH